MAARYEVWNKDNMGTGRAMPVAIYYTPDVGMDECVKLSKGSKTIKTHKVDDDNPWNYISIEVEIPNAFALVERDGQSRIRGWGIGGKWYDARDCKRCSNSGWDEEIVCTVCKGASFKPAV